MPYKIVLLNELFKPVKFGSTLNLTKKKENTRHKCVCVCVCGHVYVVYEDTNLYNDMGIT